MVDATWTIRDLGTSEGLLSVGLQDLVFEAQTSGYEKGRCMDPSTRLEARFWRARTAFHGKLILYT